MLSPHIIDSEGDLCRATTLRRVGTFKQTYEGGKEPDYNIRRRPTRVNPPLRTPLSA